jgi:hypothetical protein
VGQVLRWGVLAALVACTEPAPAPPEPVPVALLTPDVWSGGEAVLASAAFTPARGLPVVLLNDDTLAVRRTDDTTVVVQLPDLPGTQALHVLAPDILDLPIAIELRGFESAGWGPLLGGRVQVFPGGPPSVVGSGPATAVLWNLQSGVAGPLPDSMHDPFCSRRGVGPSYAGVALVSDCAPTFPWRARWRSWRLRPGFAMVDDSLCGDGGFVAELAPGRTVSELSGLRSDAGLGSPISVWVRDSLGCSETRFETRYEGPAIHDVVISPRGDRAVIHALPQGGTGMPVLDVATGQIAYELSDPFLSRAAFSADGDTLFVAGNPAEYTGGGYVVLLALRPADGQPLRSVALPLFRTAAIAVDPSRPWLYVVGTAGSFEEPHGRLLVVDRDSLALRAMVAVPDSVDVPWLVSTHGVRIVPSPSEQRVYVVWTYTSRDATDRAFLTRFRTPP